MANGNGETDLNELVRDPDFLRADLRKKIAFLSSQDADFAKANPKKQIDYINHLLKQGASDVPGAMDDFNRQANEFLLGAASGASGMTESVSPVSDTLKQMAAPRTVGQTAMEVLEGGIPAIGVGRALYGLGRDLFAPRTAGESDSDAMARRAHALGRGTGMAAPVVLGEGIPATRGAVARTMYNPGGVMKPGAVATGRVLGAGGGALVGSMLGEELGGGIAATLGEESGIYRPSGEHFGSLFGAYRGGRLGYQHGPWLLGKAFPPQLTPAETAFLPYRDLPESERVTPVRESPTPGGYKGPPPAPKPPGPPPPPLGSPENPAYHSKLPTRLPPSLRGDPFAPDYVPTGAIYPSFEDFEAATRVAKPVPLTESPYATQHEAAAAFAEGKPGPFNRVSESPYAHRDPFAPMEEPPPSPFDPSRSTSDRPRPFIPLIATPEEVGPMGTTGTLGQRMANLEKQARATGMYHAAQGAVGKKVGLQERIGGKMSKPVPPPPATPPAPTVPTSTPPTRFTPEGAPIEVETETYAGPERRGPRTVKEIWSEEIRREMREKAAEQGSIEGMKKAGKPSPGLDFARKLYPGRDLKSLQDLTAAELKHVIAEFKKKAGTR